MINKLRLIFGILVAVIVAASLALFVSTEYKEHKYSISIPSGREYTTNEYTSKDGCITFKNQWGNKVTLCGNYSIVSK
jgi:hypothetical protein